MNKKIIKEKISDLEWDKFYVKLKIEDLKTWNWNRLKNRREIKHYKNEKKRINHEIKMLDEKLKGNKKN